MVRTTRCLGEEDKAQVDERILVLAGVVVFADGRMEVRSRMGRRVDRFTSLQQKRGRLALSGEYRVNGVLKGQNWLYKPYTQSE